MAEFPAKTGATAVIEEADRAIAEALVTVEAAKREKRRAKRLRRDSVKLQAQLDGDRPGRA